MGHLNLAGVPMAAVVPAGELPTLATSLQTLDALRSRLAATQASFDSLAAANAGLLTLLAAVLTLVASLTTTVGDIATQLRQIHDQLTVPVTTAPRPKTVAQYDALFVTLGKPVIASLLHDDDTFAYMRVGGPSPCSCGKWPRCGPSSR